MQIDNNGSSQEIGRGERSQMLLDGRGWNDRLVVVLERLGWRLATLLGVAGCAMLSAFLSLVVARMSDLAFADVASMLVASIGITILVATPAFLAGFKLVDHLSVARRQLLIEIDRRVIAEQQLRRLATTDELTGLSNRRHFVAKARDVVAIARRYGQPLSLLMLDIDRFKSINDQRGHAGGDKVLQRLAGILGATVRSADHAARFGGDEFVILMPQTEKVAAILGAERLRLRIERGGGALDLTVSIGIASMHGDTASLEELMALADDALFAAKRSGRNRVFANMRDGSPHPAIALLAEDMAREPRSRTADRR